MLLASALLLVLAMLLKNNLSERFGEVQDRYADTSAVNLASGVSPEDIQNVLLLHGYVENDTDAAVIARFIADSLASGRNTLTKVYDLNKRVFQMPVRVADSLGGPLLRSLAEASRIRLGLRDSMTAVCMYQEQQISSNVSLNNGKGEMRVRVKDEEQKSVADVLVRLDRHYYDTITQKAENEAVAFARTDAEGHVCFSGLNEEWGYSVVPVREGYEYGTSQGTVAGSLGSMKEKDCDFVFTEREHRIRLFPPEVLNQIKTENSFTVRTPDWYMRRVKCDMGIMLLLWWLLFAVTIVRCGIKRQRFNQWIIPLMMLLSGFSMIVLFSISNPITEELFGSRQLRQGILIGVICVILLQLIDFDMVRFYQNKCAIKFDFLYQFIDWLFKPFRKRVVGLTEKLKSSTNVVAEIGIAIAILLCLVATVWVDLLFGLLGLLFAPMRLDRLSTKVHAVLYDGDDCMQQRLPKGSSYLVLALLLTAMLFVVGSSVGGMRVNIRIGGLCFQPSEMAKYLMVIFMAAFFCENITSIERYSRHIEGTFVKGKAKLLAGLFVGIALLLGLYVVLGDMGPGIVLTVTFVFFYSIVKSKVYLDNVPEKEHGKRIFSSDIFLLVLGLLLYVVLLKISEQVIGETWKWVGLTVWLLVWAIYCRAKRSFHETSLMMVSIISVFVFAGPVLKAIPFTETIGSRFEERNAMSENPWGHLDLHDDGMCPAVNTQVGDGLWAMATGGFRGQGMGQGNPNLIPAFHTDMILESISEQTGWIGIALIVIAVALLLLVTIRIGYATHRRFAFFMCVGIAVVTAVQFAIITLGSTGVIALTGITVPFLSYGSVSMIFNILAFGHVLSLSRKPVHVEEESKEEVMHKDMLTYRHPVMTLSGLYLLFVAFLLSIFFHYQVHDRDEVLVRPLYVLSHDQDYPMVIYNPRIGLLTQRMNSGNIYDRNGILLATNTPASIQSEEYAALGIPTSQIDNLKKRHQRRYYPVGDQLFFMIGDYNSGMYFSYRESDPRGYMAEVQHLSYLRGYDNVMYDSDSLPIRRKLSSDSYRPSRFLPGGEELESEGVVIRKYDALLPFLKAGVNSSMVNDFNEGLCDIKPQDIQLTLDARLQTTLQQQLVKYVQDNYTGEGNRRLRISVAVLNASSGDMLASANYPIPDQNVIRTHASENSYPDRSILSDFKAYTDRDLASTYATVPGSTAKVMSALAALRAYGPKAIEFREHISSNERIHNREGSEPIGNVRMDTAIIKSSNCFFIHLINHYQLYPQLDTIYRSVGIRLNTVGSYTYHYMPYTDWGEKQQQMWRTQVDAQTNNSYKSYNQYKSIREREPKKMNRGEWQWCWGQGTMDATPLAMARVASIPINGGRMPITRYLMSEHQNSVCIVDEAAAQQLQLAMRGQASRNGFREYGIGGKTGTPERTIVGRRTMKDGWYIFFIEDAVVSQKVGGRTSSGKAPLAVALRMERLSSGNSTKAMICSKNVVIPVLKELGYLTPSDSQSVNNQ